MGVAAAVHAGQDEGGLREFEGCRGFGREARNYGTKELLTALNGSRRAASGGMGATWCADATSFYRRDLVVAINEVAHNNEVASAG